MEHARIGIFEDDEALRELLVISLTNRGHVIAVEATSMEEAHRAINGLEEHSLDVAVVDNNLEPNTRTNADGAEIIRLLRKRLANITIIGSSGSGDVEGADINAPKGQRTELAIAKIIASLKKRS